MKLHYCDYIATQCRMALQRRDNEQLLLDVQHILFDVNEHGVIVSSKKTFHVVDKNMCRYRVTVEEV
jgi:hypothetical protein